MSIILNQFATKFALEHRISPIEKFRQNGHDTIHLIEQNLGCLADSKILIKAKQEKSAIAY